MNITSPILMTALALAGAPAFAGDDCHVPSERWQPREAVQQMATSRGWTLQRLKVDDGCYALRATDAQGQRIKAKVDPGSLEVIRLKRKAPRHGHARTDHDDDMQPVLNGAAQGEPGYGWQYFSTSARAVVISPDGQYYLSRGKGLRWVAGAQG